MRSTIKMEIPNVRDEDTVRDVYDGWLKYVQETGDADKGEVREMVADIRKLSALLYEGLDIVRDHAAGYTVWIGKVEALLDVKGR